jgi:hypothetical protein
MTDLNVINKIELSTCILCGEELLKLKESDTLRCDFCGKVNSISNQCTNGHSICDECLALPVNEFIKQSCLKYKGTDPIELAVSIMNSPLIRMHGPEHHFIVPAVLLTATYNLQGKQSLIPELLNKIEKIVEEESPKSCSYNLGNCGAAIGTGIFLKAYENIDNMTEDEWSLTNMIIAQSLKKVAESGGPRCCKRDTYISIESAVEFLKEKYNIELNFSDAKCTFSHRNKSCKREDCNFYNLNFSLV